MTQVAVDTHEALSVLKDPFITDKMEAFRINCFQGWGLNRHWNYTGTIEFKNGDTDGKQSFKGGSLAEVITKMQAFVDQLAQQKG